MNIKSTDHIPAYKCLNCVMAYPTENLSGCPKCKGRVTPILIEKISSDGRECHELDMLSDKTVKELERIYAL